jgi:alpha-D-ribose 1-methylphosphonate 5-phosphate C-P lyase
VAKIMGSSECEICKENDYLDEYILEDEGHSIEYRVCRNCVEEGLKLRIKKLLG